MTISPVTFATAPPIGSVERVERLKRRPGSSTRRPGSENEDEPSPELPRAARSAESFASDGTREALIGIRLGG